MDTESVRTRIWRREENGLQKGNYLSWSLRGGPGDSMLERKRQEDEVRET